MLGNLEKIGRILDSFGVGGRSVKEDCGIFKGQKYAGKFGKGALGALGRHTSGTAILNNPCFPYLC